MANIGRVRVQDKYRVYMWSGEGQGWVIVIDIVIVIVIIVIGLDLKCMLQLFCACIQLCLKCSSQTSRLRIQEMASIIQRMKKFNNMIRMVR